MILNEYVCKKAPWFKFFILVIFILANFILASVSFKAQALQPNNVVHKFVSTIDGAEDYYSLVCGVPGVSELPGTLGTSGMSRVPGKTGVLGVSGASAIPEKNGTLIVYLHSLSGDYNEPFTLNGDSSLASALLKEFPGSSFMSFNYGHTPSWGNAAARVDISKFLGLTIKALKINRILLVGVSMGASTALVYTATAPDYIKDKIVGVVAVSPCANLEDLYRQTATPEIKSSLENTFGAVKDATPMPIGFEQNSLDTCVIFFPSKVKVGVISATEDKAVPIDLQKDVVRDLNNRDIKVKAYEIEGKFDGLPVTSILEASRLVMK